MLRRATREDAMAKQRAEIELGAQPDAAWAVVGNFGSIGDWMPGIESCVVDGDDRVLRLMGMEVTERLQQRDDEARTLSYRIVGGVPVINHLATISVVADGEGSRVTWDVDVDPDDMGPLLQATYQQALEALKVHLGG
jgi:carbon monoxide dehydrogenase subunit G